MNGLLRWWRWFRRGPQPEPVNDISPNVAYQIGFQNGDASGEIRGRNLAIVDLEHILASRGKEEFEAEDVARLRHRTLH